MTDLIQTLIDRYQLQAHPEGGYFCETYRSVSQLESPITRSTRNAITHIYFLLTEGQVSRFHKVLHDEIWNFYAGSPLALLQYDNGQLTKTIIGNEHIEATTQNDYTTVIPAGKWQAAESTGAYSFVGCSVAPGFDFSDFSFMNQQEQLAFLSHFKELSRFI